MLIFSQKADDNLASLVKAVDEVQKNNAKLGTVVVGVSGVEERTSRSSRARTN